MTWAANTPRIGIVDLNAVVLPALGEPGISNLPSVTTEPQAGEIATGWDPVLGGGEFIFLAIPANTAIPAGTIVKYTGTASGGYQVAAIDAGGTSKNTGRPLAVALVAVASSTSVQYAWFQIQGQVQVLKTAVQVTLDSGLYLSATAGRFYVTSSAGKQILGARTMNTATVTSTTSSVLCYINRPVIEGA